MSDSNKATQRGTISFTTENHKQSVDNVSKKGAFGWDTIGNASIPYILRGEEHYLSVRMVENKLLSKYPSAYPVEISSRPPLASDFVTTAEATLLNEINRDHCDHGFGHDLFTTDDIIVRVQEFKDFFAIVQKHFDNISVEIEPGEVIKQKPEVRQVTGGWLQVNNTIIPFFHRAGTSLKFVPLSVVKYAAGLLTEITRDGYELTQDECVFLTNICTEAGLTFNFKPSTKALTIDLVCQLSKNVIVKELPKGDPFEHAEHSEDGDVESAVNNLPELGVRQSILPPVNNLPELTMRQSVLPHAHSPPEQVIPQSVLLPNNSYYQNVAINRLHSPIDSVMTHRSQQGSVRDKTFQPTAHHFNPSYREPTQGAASNSPYSEVATGAMSNLPDHRSHIQTLTTQHQPPQRHLEKIQELNNRYLPLVNRHEGDMTGMGHPSMMIPQHIRPHAAGSPVPGVAGSTVHNDPRWHMPHSHIQQQMLHRQMQMQMHGGRPSQVPPTGVSLRNAATKEEPVIIKPVQLCGKTVSCVSRQDGKYTLIEAVCKVFFPRMALDEFRYAVEKILKVPLHKLTDEEECAFQRFYELPPTAGGLSCKSSINITHFKAIIPRLRMMFYGPPKPQGIPQTALKRPLQDSSHQKNRQTMKSKSQKLDDAVKRLTSKAALSNNST